MENKSVSIAIRVHTDLPVKGASSEKKNSCRESFGKRILVFDTETTVDQYQNLLVGQAFICEGTRHVHIDGQIKEKYIFYGEAISPLELTIIKNHAKKNGLFLLSRKEFVEEVLLPEITLMGSVCVGFNLPFDLSRMAVKSRTYKRGKHKDEIELIFDENNRYLPTITINSLDSKRAFIKLRNSTIGKPASPNIPFSKAAFLDLRTLVFALTSESRSLAKACEQFKTPHQKIEAEGHGEITSEYLAYNTNDVLATLDLYIKTVEEFYLHPVDKTPAEVYSPASVGKAYFEVMGIGPLREKQTNFPTKVLGYAMASYYGGRAECHFRRIPVKAFHVDIMSMYPSVFVLQGLWQWVIADSVEFVDASEEIQDFLDSVKLVDLFKKETWKQIPVLVAIRPEGDLLPVRAEYVTNTGYQIGWNHSTCDKVLWYTLADLVVSKILTGKTPKFERAIRIIPGPPQEGFKSIKLRGQKIINPEDDLFKVLIEMRQEEKGKITEDGDEHDTLQYFMKIFANATSYGINVEANRTEFDEPVSSTVYGIDDPFIFECEQLDVPGKYYNPLVATMITGAAHLVLAMIEGCVMELGGNYAFCDTDSLDIVDLVNNKPEQIGSQVVDRFRSLMPYNLPAKNGESRSLLEAEDYNWERIDWDKDTDEGNV